MRIPPIMHSKVLFAGVYQNAPLRGTAGKDYEYFGGLVLNDDQNGSQMSELHEIEGIRKSDPEMYTARLQEFGTRIQGQVKKDPPEPDNTALQIKGAKEFEAWLHATAEETERLHGSDLNAEDLHRSPTPDPFATQYGV